MATLIGQEEWGAKEKRGQVYLATHDGEGNHLSAMQRSFISFSWGNKDIEDFSLIATFDSGRYVNQMYASFEDSVTEYDIIDGQKFWGSRYEAHGVSFTLSTDGMTEKQLQEFKNWFRPGIARDLILAESPNRVISARVTAAPEMSMVPYETEEVIKVGSKEYTTSSTLWKGDITLSFIMDDPFWQAKINYFEDSALEKNNENVKTVVEDGIPVASMFEAGTYFLAGGQILTVEAPGTSDGNEFSNEGDSSSEGAGESSDNNDSPSETEPSNETKPSDEDKSTMNIEGNAPYNLYYCGTAKSKPILKFTLTPTFDDDDYINFPKNFYVDSENKYNTITLGDKKFCFTTPGILTSYNQVVKLVTEDFEAGDSCIELKQAIRETITDYYVRSVAHGICEKEFGPDDGALPSDFKTTIISGLKKMLNGKSMDFTINSQDGTASMETEIQIPVYDTDTETQNSESTTQTESTTSTGSKKIIQNVGDMVRSDYLIIEDRILPKADENGNLKITENECLHLTADCSLTNFSIEYKYMYL